MFNISCSLASRLRVGKSGPVGRISAAGSWAGLWERFPGGRHDVLDLQHTCRRASIMSILASMHETLGVVVVRVSQSDPSHYYSLIACWSSDLPHRSKCMASERHIRTWSADGSEIKGISLLIGSDCTSSFSLQPLRVLCVTAGAWVATSRNAKAIPE